MRCNHCGTPGGSDQRVAFERDRRCELTLCANCIREFEREESVRAVTPAIAR